MEKAKKPRKKKAEAKAPLETRVEKLKTSTHKAEIRDGVVIIVPEMEELPLDDPRNELANSIKDEELEINKVQGIITVRKSYDSEVQYVIDDLSQVLDHKQASLAREQNSKNAEEVRVDLKKQNYNGSVIVESESYQDIMEVLKYQDSGKIPK